MKPDVRNPPSGILSQVNHIFFRMTFHSLDARSCIHQPSKVGETCKYLNRIPFRALLHMYKKDEHIFLLLRYSWVLLSDVIEMN